MARLLRFVAYLVGVVVVLVVVASIVLPLVVDPNDYKDDIAAAVNERTGRQLSIEGDIGLSVFPWLALEIGPTRLSNAAGFSDRPFAAVKDVQVRIKLLPLLAKRVEMDTVVLNGLQLSLETRADGTNNWADLAEAGVKSEPVQPAEDAPSEGGMALAALAIGGVEITDAELVWDDRSQDARYEIGGLSLRTGAIAPGATVPIELDLALASTQPPIQGPLAFNAELSLSDDSQVVSVAGAALTGDLRGEALPGGALKAKLGFDAELNLETGSLDVSDLVAALLGLELQGQAKGSKLFDAPAFDATLALKEFVPRELIEALGQPLPEVSDPSVLGKADARLTLAATGDRVNVTDLRLRLDDSAVTGKASVTNFAKPAIRFALHLDQIDVDRYLPPASDQPPATPTTAAAAGAQLIPVDVLRELNVDGSLKIDKLKAAQLRSTDIEMKLVASGGQVRVYPAKANMYQGQYNGDVRLDVRGKLPKISLNEKLAGVQIGPLLKDLNGKESLSGTTRAEAALTATGQTPEALKKSLNGSLNFAFTNGAVKGFNLAALIRKAQAQLSGQPLPAESGPDQTDFSELTGTATVSNGVITNRDLLAKSPLLRVSGEGTVDLPAEALDYLVTAKVVSSLEGQGGKGLDELKGVAIPVQLSGTFADPQYKIRLDQAVRDKAEKKIKKKLEKKLEKKFGDQFKGLFQ